ncbi:protein-L-isoaspartate O-methyltransferase family protein [Bosea lathyri]|uniref:Protein-L-isoaspartate O-methyltransferase n=1 Tax=Bosea lathyri TaxID=1036778 RepID=A0A1H5VC12_9HYPH|nr:methyltransferase domain-containing protein [Bosea lathyri]SEF84915.1 protein-L-isoaspartate(D-aspartate) O-methyltransferase [Bosea lathyri]
MRFDEQQLAVVRRAYARQMLALVGVEGNRRLQDAFATIPRERFVGEPPWQLSQGRRRYAALASDDPAVLYQDVLIALAPERGINNGSPSLHALWLNALDPREGERIVHIGAGTGYYSAILAQLVGPGGHVAAVEYDPVLAERAAANLADMTNVTVIRGDGAEWPREPADCIYVNFAVVRLSPFWLDQLLPGGRLIFPLGLPSSRSGRRNRRGLVGAGFLVERRADGFAASWLGEPSFVSAEGVLAGSEGEQAALAAAFESEGAESVRSLQRGEGAPSERCWLRGEGWCLSYDEVPVRSEY